jgi:radical SAM superfamily enzyme YgiQ (UPF0313 family)
VAICRGMIEAKLDLTWSCNADLHALDEDKMAWMKKAGCHTVSVGIESGDEAMLKKYSKMITVEEVRAKVARLNDHTRSRSWATSSSACRARLASRPSGPSPWPGA